MASLCAAAAVAIGVSAWAILDERLRLGGVWAAVAGALLVGAGILAKRTEDVRSAVYVSFVDRAFDGVVLASVAWVTRTSEPSASAGALVALAAGFLAAYVGARGRALGYELEESEATRAVRVGLVAAALIGGWTSWALFVAAGWMLLVTLVRVSQVAKQERV